MTLSSTRPRAAAAVLRSQGEEILMVKHRWRDGTTSWILPGGALLPEEKSELEDVAWFSIQEVREHPEVQQVLACIQRPGEDRPEG
ncbi:MAG TPA: NUDIX hydrolase [Ktedonobacteraceae bacterium]|nr:NUDIX hydrolase [Ktedonobacteraceae bacterium]